jgi:hypothetical protein
VSLVQTQGEVLVIQRIVTAFGEAVIGLMAIGVFLYVCVWIHRLLHYLDGRVP